MTTIRIPPVLRDATGGKRQVEATGADVRELLENLATSYPQLRERSEEHTSELQSRLHLVCRVLLEKKSLVSGGDAVPVLVVRTGSCRFPRAGRVDSSRPAAYSEFAEAWVRA